MDQPTNTGAIDFTATIHTDNLAYLGWEGEPRAESVHILLEDFHTRYNCIPYSALRHLMRIDLWMGYLTIQQVRMPMILARIVLMVNLLVCPTRGQLLVLMSLA